MSTQTAAAMDVGILLKTCHIAGTALVAPGMNRMKIDASAFPGFFALSGAVITQPDGTKAQEQVVVVNREAIIALGRPNES
jgi:hypothetical protein